MRTLALCVILSFSNAIISGIYANHADWGGCIFGGLVSIMFALLASAELIAIKLKKS